MNLIKTETCMWGIGKEKKRCNKLARKIEINSKDNTTITIWICDKHLPLLLKNFCKLKKKQIEPIIKVAKQHPYNPLFDISD